MHSTFVKRCLPWYVVVVSEFFFVGFLSNFEVVLSDENRKNGKVHERPGNIGSAGGLCKFQWIFIIINDHNFIFPPVESDVNNSFATTSTIEAQTTHFN